MEPVIDIPDEWDHFDGSTYYKICIHHSRRLVMMYNNGDYRRSQRSEEEVIIASMPESEVRVDKILKVDIVRETIKSQGPLSKGQVRDLSGTRDSTCRESIRTLKNNGEIKLIDGYYSYVGKPQRDMFEGLRL